MNLPVSTAVFAILVILLLAAAGCTSTPGAVTPPGTTQPSGTPPAPSATAPPATTGGGGISATIRVHFNDYACIGIQDVLGVDYLHPEERILIRAASPGTVNVNILMLDATDNMRIRQTRPSWDSVKKTWIYEGVVPMLQFSDLTSAQEKIVTIRNQGKYYLCADDRKETGVSDAYYQVPVTISRA